MNNICPVCGQEANCWSTFQGEHMCFTCSREKHRQYIVDQSAAAESPRDFKDWKGSDLSDAFWEALIAYQKEPTLHGIETMNRIFLWSCHANHTLSSTIVYACKWAGFDLHTELRRMRELHK